MDWVPNCSRVMLQYKFRFDGTLGTNASIERIMHFFSDDKINSGVEFPNFYICVADSLDPNYKRFFASIKGWGRGNDKFVLMYSYRKTTNLSTYFSFNGSNDTKTVEVPLDGEGTLNFEENNFITAEQCISIFLEFLNNEGVVELSPHLIQTQRLGS